ncbi:MAG: ATP-binding cassette domain-containing protein [Planctomycetaceae bacterium]|nr:ATP-binding cassette domain-containing protein [Planctomycetaceae bacterium]
MKPESGNHALVWAVVNPISRVVQHPLTLTRAEGNPFIILRGPNGAGKSTVFKALIGLDGSRGSRLISHEEEVVVADDRSLIRYMPQDPDDALFGKLSVADNVRLLSWMFSIAGDFADKSDCTRFDPGLPSHQLSLGEKKLLLLEAILASLPPPRNKPYVFVLLDEPLAGLDFERRKSMCDRLNSKATEYRDSANVTFVIIDHDDILPAAGARESSVEVRTGVSFHLTSTAQLLLRV